MVRRRSFAIGIVAMCLVACVAIPQEVKQTFEPAGPGETSYFQRRLDAPRPEGFVAPAPAPAPLPTTAPAPEPPPAAPASGDGGAP
jgi:hypothetical protein